MEGGDQPLSVPRCREVAGQSIALNQPCKLASEKGVNWGYQGEGKGTWRCEKKVEKFLQHDLKRTVNRMKKN